MDLGSHWNKLKSDIMRLPIQFIYTKNGVKKDSIAENERMNYIDQLNRDLLKNNLKTIKC